MCDNVTAYNFPFCYPVFVKEVKYKLIPFLLTVNQGKWNCHFRLRKMEGYFSVINITVKDWNNIERIYHIQKSFPSYVNLRKPKNNKNVKQNK